MTNLNSRLLRLFYRCILGTISKKQVEKVGFELDGEGRHIKPIDKEKAKFTFDCAKPERISIQLEKQQDAKFNKKSLNLDSERVSSIL